MSCRIHLWLELQSNPIVVRRAEKHLARAQTVVEN